VSKEMGERRELQQIDLNEAKAGEPNTVLTNSEELGRRTYANKRSKSFSKKSSEEKI